VDLSDAHAVDAAMQRVLAETGVPAVIVNNAGAGRWLNPEDTPSEEVVSMMAAPYFAAFFVTRAVLPGMLARGSGRIVNVTSPVSFIAWPGATAYAAARWAMRGFHEALTADLAGTGVGVTLATFGKVSSDYFTTNAGSEERVPKISRLVPTLTPEEAADALVAGVRDEDRTITAPFMLRLFLGLNRVVRGRLVDHAAHGVPEEEWLIRTTSTAVQARRRCFGSSGSSRAFSRSGSGSRTCWEATAPSRRRLLRSACCRFREKDPPPSRRGLPKPSRVP
jgi:short-subunit dehydrogenase